MLASAFFEENENHQSEVEPISDLPFRRIHIAAEYLEGPYWKVLRLATTARKFNLNGIELGKRGKQVRRILLSSKAPCS